MPNPTPPPDPLRPTDDTARALGRSLIEAARYGALAALNPETGRPTISRIAVATGPCGHPLTLVSDLSQHTRALRANPLAALLLGEPGSRGDPLTHPRISLDVTAEFVARTDPQHDTLRAHYLRLRPKSRLYVDFADFSFVRLRVVTAALNGGFGKAFALDARDLGLG